METQLADFIRDTAAGREAQAILRRCVHCGFCNATCPTYQLFGDELDGPRGRIYQIKQVLEGSEPTAKTRLHLDRCLNCRACETTCPSGVDYTHLLDIGRDVVEKRLPRRTGEALVRGLLRNGLTRPAWFGATLRLAQIVRPILPKSFQARIPPSVATAIIPGPRHSRRWILLAGCVQPAMYPNINAAARRVLDQLEIDLIEAPGAGCCGAIRHHLNDSGGGKEDARRNISAWWPLLSAGAEGLVMTASGCGAHILDYAHQFENDADYADKAGQVSQVTQDISTLIAAEAERLSALLKQCPPLPESGRKLAFHSPCTLQHGLRVRGVVETLLIAAGYELTPVNDAHLCCGSAGTYSILQPDIAGQLKRDKLKALMAPAPSAIASANVGCIAHLQADAHVPVMHWIELIDQRLSLSALNQGRLTTVCNADPR
jgi:glycolate oxidase iron-sulfur subunit